MAGTNIVPLSALGSPYPIPDAALDDRLGWIGTSGSGETYNSGGGVERLLQSGARVVIVDPLGVWWGLRLLADRRRSHDRLGPHRHLARLRAGRRGARCLVPVEGPRPRKINPTLVKLNEFVQRGSS
jgi:DNA helicase HerA-like ATPase